MRNNNQQLKARKLYTLPIVVILSGRATSGKSTIASLLKTGLESIYNISAEVHPFARALKEYCAKYRNWDGTKTPEQRQILIDTAAEFRAKDELHWARIVSREIDSSYAAVCLIDDWRYEFEQAHLANSFPVFRIKVLRDVPLIDDDSERRQETFSVDATVVNTGSLATAGAQLQLVLSTIADMVDSQELACGLVPGNRYTMQTGRWT